MNLPELSTGRKTRYLKCFFLMLILAGFLSAVASAASVDDYIKDGEKYFEKRELSAAVIQFKNALQRDPSNVRARLMLGRTYVRQRDGEAAEKELKRARELGAPREQWIVPLARAYLLEVKPTELLGEITVDATAPAKLRADVMVLQARADLLEGRQLDAQDRLEDALALVPGHAEAQLGKAQLLLSENQREAALAQANKAVESDPELVDAWVLKGELHRVLSQFDASVAAFKRAIELESNNEVARLGRAAVYLAQGDLDRARDDIGNVHKRYPNLPAANYLKGLLALEEKDLQGAEESVQMALRVAPDHRRSQLLMGTVSYRLKKYRQAEQYLEDFLQAEPDHVPAIKLLGATLIDTKQAERAIRLLKPVAKSLPDDPQINALIGSAYMMNGQRDEGLRHLKKASDKAPDMAAVRAQLAVGYLASGMADEAASELKTAVDLDQGLVQADVLLILTRIKNKQYDEAIASADGLARKLPESPVPYNLRGAANLAAGNPDAARADFNKALKIKEQFAPARVNIARLDERAGKYSDAEKGYSEVLAYQPENFSALMGLARLAQQRGDIPTVVKWLQVARERNPWAAQPALLLIDYYLAQQDSDKALTLARELVNEQPSNPTAVRALGVAQVQAGLDPSAAITFKKLINLDDKNAESHFLLAGVQARRGDLKSARSSLSRALAIDPDYLAAHRALAEMALGAGRYKETLKIAREIQKRHPDSAVGIELEGDVHLAQGRYKQAANLYRKAAATGQSDQAPIKAFSAMEKSGQGAEGQKALRAWLEKNPDSIDARILLAGYEQGSGEAEQAIKDYEQVLKYDNANLLALNNLAWLYHGRDDRKGLKYAERAYRADPERVEVVDTYGWLLLKRGRTEQALDLLKSAAVKAPHLPEIRYHYAVALNEAGHVQEARRELSRVLKSSSTFPGADEARSLLKKLNP